MNTSMVQSDLYIHGPQAQRHAIVQMLMRIAQRIGIDTSDESALNIPIGMVMDVLLATLCTQVRSSESILRTPSV